MTSEKKVNLRGTLVAVTPSGRCGVVRLDDPCDGFSLAVINDDTAGRIGLMSLSPDGCLKPGTPVVITAVMRGVDAYLAQVVTPA